MGLVSSLPPRPLSPGELTKLNDSTAVDLVAPVTDDGDAAADASGSVRGVLVATESWVQALAFTRDRWEAVARVNLDGTDRYDALRACEAEAKAALGRETVGSTPNADTRGGDGDADTRGADSDPDRLDMDDP